MDVHGTGTINHIASNIGIESALQIHVLDLSQYLGHDLWEFFRDSSGWVSHRFDQPSNQNRLTADRSDEVEALWKSRQKNVGGS